MQLAWDLGEWKSARGRRQTQVLLGLTPGRLAASINARRFAIWPPATLLSPPMLAAERPSPQFDDVRSARFAAIGIGVGRAWTCSATHEK
jgi:hypothetical protein